MPCSLPSRITTQFLKNCNTFSSRPRPMGGATRGCGGTMSPSLLGPAGYRGWSNENDFCFYSRQSLFMYCTSDWISAPLTLVDTCQVNDIWKDSLGRVSTVHPHWTAALFKSTCQHAHAAVNWLSMLLSRHTCQCQISLASIFYFPASSSLIHWYIFACLYPTFGKVGYKIFSAHCAHESCFIPPP